MRGTWPLLRRETIRCIDSTEALRGQVFHACLKADQEVVFLKCKENLRESKTRVLQYFFELGREKVPEEWEAKTIRSLWKRSRKLGFSAFAFHDERWTAGSAVRQAAV
ncbi:CDG_1a_G0031330.mRNA.1.CDS.1 [Saccharomyces cerevisiae]|nr:CDG_1a_G0031330.mRNA.1.CDS.1 [Saccharomyces cerevisiae]CAI7372743.1 CDG_1a_G0031330.mRNA.1.CDS.1 [Saccharomyces cerevisiae]